MAKAWKMAKETSEANEEVSVTTESQPECDRDDSSQSSSDSEND